MVRERPDLKPYEGRELTVIAWLWARTVKSPNPAFADVNVPLASTFLLSTKRGREAYVEPVIEGRGYRFAVKVGAPPDADAARAGTKLSRGANFRCLMSGSPIAGDYIKAEGQAKRLGARLMAWDSSPSKLQLRNTFGPLLCLAPPLAKASVPGVVLHPRRAEGRRTGRHPRTGTAARPRLRHSSSRV